MPKITFFFSVSLNYEGYYTACFWNKWGVCYMRTHYDSSMKIFFGICFHLQNLGLFKLFWEYCPKCNNKQFSCILKFSYGSRRHIGCPLFPRFSCSNGRLNENWCDSSIWTRKLQDSNIVLNDRIYNNTFKLGFLDLMGLKK